MRFQHDGKTYQLPASLSEIKLEQVILFQQKYGNETETFFQNADKEDELEMLGIMTDLACKSVSFFSGIPLEKIYQSDLAEIVVLYQSTLAPLFEQGERELQPQYYFADEVWEISSPQLTFDNSMTFNELILGKEITRQMKNFAGGRFEALKHLSVIYFRKKNEKFCEGWMSEYSERMQLLNDLPVDIALDVAFFLQSSMSMFLESFLSSEKAEVADQT